MVRWVQRWLKHRQHFILNSCEGSTYAGRLVVATGAMVAVVALHQQPQKPQHADANKLLLSQYATNLPSYVRVVRCDDGLLYAEKDFPDGYSEADRFLEVLEYHRSLLPDYIRRWTMDATSTTKRNRVSWPPNVPTDSEIGPLELDLNFCRRSPNYRGANDTCDDLKFRIASYYLAKDDQNYRKKGFHMVKDLAEHGHSDAMCYYGILLNQGNIEGVDANPEQAVVWWRRCVDFHRHIWASFELGVALYTGEGVAENPGLASKFFRQAAHLGHAGAAYMLGDLLLNGVGIERDRASALEWFVTAAELGHPLAQERVIFIIQQDYETLQKGDKSSKSSETLKWVNNPDNQEAREVMVERRYTIGGGSQNPEVLKRRKTVVKESREDE